MNAAAPGEPSGAAAFPWDEAMAAGFAVLKLSPSEFWRSTPLELANALRPFAARASEPPSRTALLDLMQRFPDRR